MKKIDFLSSVHTEKVELFQVNDELYDYLDMSISVDKREKFLETTIVEVLNFPDYDSAELYCDELRRHISILINLNEQHDQVYRNLRENVVIFTNSQQATYSVRCLGFYVFHGENSDLSTDVFFDIADLNNKQALSIKVVTNIERKSTITKN
jgi:hypothetical protein